MYLSVQYGSHNKQRLFSYKASLTGVSNLSVLFFLWFTIRISVDLAD